MLQINQIQVQCEDEIQLISVLCVVSKKVIISRKTTQLHVKAHIGRCVCAIKYNNNKKIEQSNIV